MNQETNEPKEVLNALVFDNEEFGNMRVMMIGDKPYFVASDIAKALGYAKPNNAINRHCKYTLKRGIATSQGNIAATNIIPEGDVYRLIVRSKLPEADKFESWVFDEVLPQIRKTGGYIPVDKEEDDLVIMSKAVRILKRTLDQKDELLAEREETLKQQKPLVDFANTVSGSPTLVDMKTMAKLLEKENQDIHMGRNKLFAWLRKEGYLMSDNTPYERYVKQGIFKLTESEVETKNGSKLITKTYVTGKGQLYLAKKLAEYFASQSASA